MKKKPINLHDQLNKVYVMIRSGENKKWERWVSTDKKEWIKTHKSLSLDEVMRIKEKVVFNNYNNLYNIVVPKK